MKNFNLEAEYTDYHDLVNGLEAFTFLTKKEKTRLASGITLMSFERQDVIFKQNMPSDHVVYVVSGLIKVYSGGRANRIICFKLAGPGSFAALSSAFSLSVYRHSAAAVEQTVALMIRKKTLKDIMNQNGRFSMMIINLMGKEIIELSNKLVTFSIKQLPGKVADLLRHFSEDVFGSNEFTISLTRQEMAELIGTTKESLIRTLNEFKNDKIIDLDGKKIKILSPDLVKVLSEIG
ncbi:MAG: Crp/Fnr family transcriptional regulator [Bacteroidales bacterium]|jgi:CRP/FNR family transcriptional regulator|nr:Crp/Fnr family transcriptional regulator [Bacteroidales bacterium]